MESAKLDREKKKFKIKKRKFASIISFDFQSNTTKPRRRYSFDIHQFFNYRASPVSPNSSLFKRPIESPGYLQLNQQLSDLFTELSINTQSHLIQNPAKLIQVRNTACSSLLQRRNKSQKISRLVPLFTN